VPLAELQRALATVATDEVSRERLRSDPSRFARDFALASNDLAAVVAFGERGLHAYVDSLARKRASACAHALPLTARALGSRFRSAFLRYARTHRLGEGRNRYREDARAFARLLARDAGLSGPMRALVSYESSFGPCIRSYAYFVPDLVRSVRAGASIDAAKRRTTIVFALSRGRRIVFAVP
jgi:hypothetical protein